MKKPNSDSANKDTETQADLAHRLERYRQRVEAEGRKRSLKIIDRAIRDAGAKQ